MTTIDKWYALVSYIINKNQNGTVTPDQFNIIINVGQRSFLSYLVREYKSAQADAQMGKGELGQSGRMMEVLAPFIAQASSIAINVSTGIAPYPGDYVAFEAMYWTGNKRVKEIQQDRVDSHVNSFIDPIATNPVFMFVSTGFQFFPATLGTALLSYIKSPDIKYAYTLDGNGRQVYDSGNSVQPLWSDLDFMEVIVRALAMIGVNLSAAQVSQYAQMIKKDTQ